MPGCTNPATVLAPLVRYSHVATVAVVLAAGSGAVGAQETSVEAFTLPTPAERIMPTYPAGQLRVGGEGLVLVDFMIDTEGRPFDPVVLESTGDASFHEAAIDALLASRYEPARLGSEAIVGSSRTLYRFDMAVESRGASPEFVSGYRVVQRSLERGERADIEDALARLEKLGARNHYEYAFLGLARYSHARQFGTELEQMEHLRQALSISTTPDDPLYLEEDLVTELRRALLPLQLKHNYFAEAVDTYELMQASGDADGVATYAPAIDAVAKLRADATEYAIPLALDASGSRTLDLFKRNFALTGGEGDLTEVVLRCERRHLAFRIERDLSYAMQPEWGDCSLQILGDAGAKFFLLQH